MAKVKTYSTTIAIDAERCMFHFYSMAGNDKSSITHFVKKFPEGPMDEQFFTKFKEAVQKYTQRVPSQNVRKITVVLPDKAILTDTVRVPTMKGMEKTQQALDDKLSGWFRNYDELYVASDVMDQNKQFTTFAISMVKKEIVSNIYSICAENKLLVDTLAFTSSAAVCGALQFNPKLRNANCMFLDIKGASSRFVFIVNGNALGSYTLPFGLDFLRSPEVIPEEMLFDHSYAELALWYAKARVKSVKAEAAEQANPEDTADDLEIIPEDTEELPAVTEPEEEETAAQEAIDFDFDATEDDEEDYEDEEDDIPDEEQTPDDDATIVDVEEFLKKTPRKLPRFMIREVPDTPEGVCCENFRVFVKWALSLMQNNERITELGKPEFVCVNLPPEMAFVLDRVNEEEEENQVRFTALRTEGDQPEIFGNLEMYGGLFPKQICWNGRF